MAVQTCQIFASQTGVAFSESQVMLYLLKPSLDTLDICQKLYPDLPISTIQAYYQDLSQNTIFFDSLIGQSHQISLDFCKFMTGRILSQLSACNECHYQINAC